MTRSEAEGGGARSAEPDQEDEGPRPGVRQRNADRRGGGGGQDGPQTLAGGGGGGEGGGVPEGAGVAQKLSGERSSKAPQRPIALILAPASDHDIL